MSAPQICKRNIPTPNSHKIPYPKDLKVANSKFKRILRVFLHIDISYLLNVIIRECTSILQLLSSEDQSLLVRGNALLVLYLRLNIVDSVGRLNLEGYSLARKGLDEAGVQSSVFKVRVPVSVLVILTSALIAHPKLAEISR